MNWNKIKTLYMLFLNLLSCYYITAKEYNNKFVIFDDDEPIPNIYIPQNTSLLERQAAFELSRVISKMGSYQAEVINDPPKSGQRGIYIGLTPQTAHLFNIIKPLDKEAFILRTWNDDLLILGKTPQATLSAVYWFLQNYGGVRWYLPGKIGEYVPERKSWVIDNLDKVVEPAFLSRVFSGIRGYDGKLWQQRNLLTRRYDFHHNLSNIIRYDHFSEHPDWFPLIRDSRYQPNGKMDLNYQPDLSNMEVVDQVANTANKFFIKNYNTATFSIGLNDSNKFGEIDFGYLKNSSKRYFRGVPDYSNYVFDFTNKVAQKVLLSHSDKYIGCLAYSWYENTPTFKVLPNVLPYLTADRSQWYDKKFKQQDKALISRWVNNGSKIVGIYDYYYGNNYIIPRFYPSLINESIKFAWKAGVKGFYAEIYPIWGLNGAQPWIVTQLLWNPDQNSVKLLDDFYTNFFQEAALPMRKYFDLCEKQWLGQSGKARWLKYYRNIQQLIIFPPIVCEELKKFLDEATALTKSTVIKDRIRLYSEAFEVTEKFSNYFYLLNKLAKDTIVSKESLENTIQDLSVYMKIRYELWNYINDESNFHKLNSRLYGNKYLFEWDPSPKIISQILLFGLKELILNDVTTNLIDLIQKSKINRLLLLVNSIQRFISEEQNSTQLIKNPSLEKLRSFENSDLRAKSRKLFVLEKLPVSWELEAIPAEGLEIKFNKKAARSGAFGMFIKNSEVTILSQKLKVSPNKHYSFKVWTKYKSSSATKIFLDIQWINNQGETIKSSLVDRLPIGESYDWHPLNIIILSPENAHSASFNLNIIYQEADDYLFADDFEVNELP